jgi:HEPN domain-containing protein
MNMPHREAQRWHAQAEDDLKFTLWIFSEAVFFDKGCFLAQQAGEKTLKACLYAQGHRRVIGHSLLEMTDALSSTDPRFSDILSAAKRLDRFYISTRYPNGIPGGSPYQVFELDDLQKAVQDLEAIFDLTRRFLHEHSIQVE